jgi:hypothetical protein
MDTKRIGNLEGNKSRGRLVRLQGDCIKIGVTGKEREGVYWIHLTEDRDQYLTLVSTIMELQVDKELGISRLLFSGGILPHRGSWLVSWLLAVYSELHTKLINDLCEQSLVLFNVKSWGI